MIAAASAARFESSRILEIHVCRSEARGHDVQAGSTRPAGVDTGYASNVIAHERGCAIVEMNIRSHRCAGFRRVSQTQCMTHLVSGDLLKLRPIRKVTKCVRVERHVSFDGLPVDHAANVFRRARQVPYNTGNCENARATLR